MDQGSDTSSPASADGASLSATQVLTMARTSGLEAVLVNHSARPGVEKETTTSATSGPRGSSSSKSVALQLSLESKLRARLDSIGCRLYALTWGARDMLSGAPICRLVASEHRTKDSACSSWPTPTRAASGNGYTYREGNHDEKCLTLIGAARLASWTTPRGSERGTDLVTQVHLTTWSTPAVKEAGGTPEQFLDRKRKAVANGSSLGVSLTSLSLQAQLADIGSTPTGFSAATAKPGQLNPEHSRWLMGYPAEWGKFAVTETRSTRSSAASSSKPRSKRSKKTG